MNIAEKLMEDFRTAQEEAHKIIVAGDNKKDVDCIEAMFDPLKGELRFVRNGETTDFFKVTELGAVKALLTALTKTTT